MGVLRLPCACATLRRATRAITVMYEEAFRPVGLTAPQYTVMAVLYALGETNQGRVSQILAIDSTTLTRILLLMRKHGWIHSAVGADRRERNLSLTPSGRTLFERAKPLWRAAQNRLKQQYGEDWERLFATVDHVTASVQQLTDPAPTPATEPPTSAPPRATRSSR